MVLEIFLGRVFFYKKIYITFTLFWILVNMLKTKKLRCLSVLRWKTKRWFLIMVVYTIEESKIHFFWSSWLFQAASKIIFWLHIAYTFYHVILSPSLNKCYFDFNADRIFYRRNLFFVLVERKILKMDKTIKQEKNTN